LRDGPRSFSRDFTCPAILRVPVGATSLSSTGLSPSLADRSRSFDYAGGLSLRVTGPTTPPCTHDGLGCSAFARRYWRNHCCFLFLWVLRWFTSPRCPRTAYGFGGGSFGISRREFPHSEIAGSKLVCSSPALIAAYRVLHRLLVPRHSPYTLSSLTIRNSLESLPRFGIRDSGFAVRIPNPKPRSTTADSASCNTACGRKKLPFAEYSVVKEPSARTIGRCIQTVCRPAAACQPTSALRAPVGEPSEVLPIVLPKGAKVGEYRARTGDLLVANQALSQLS
jgi:hypothetical protein